jgi:AbrB family looped-hinge helix DNA binding protein
MDQMECYPTILARGQVTIPQEVRDTLGLDKGDQVKLTVEKIE